ncbi:MAG TPA: diguanylate cyclase, partial [Amycolatopsis sp.]|nr:diguanylate cyclase [Amycolatopsis sp.]
MTVLVADDSLLIRTVVRAALEGEGYAVAEAGDGLAAVECCHRMAPDIVLLDMEMPGLNGRQVLAELKSSERLCDIPVVFLTGHTEMSDVLGALRSGAHDYLKKPFEPAELLARVGAAAQVKKLHDELRARNAELERMSSTDTLTGLDNRRHIEEKLRQQCSAARRRREPVAVLLLDLDHFKRVNDTYGHPVGDQVLAEFAHRLRRELRAEDIACRWGGEEFLVVLPGTGLADATSVAERIRSATSVTPIRAGDQQIRVTVS